MREAETMDDLPRFLLRHALAGTAAGWLTVAGLLALDVAALRTLIFASEFWPLPLVMLLTGFTVTFASAAMGAAIMGLGRPPKPPRRQPVRVRPVIGARVPARW